MGGALWELTSAEGGPAGADAAAAGGPTDLGGPPHAAASKTGGEAPSSAEGGPAGADAVAAGGPTDLGGPSHGDDSSTGGEASSSQERTREDCNNVRRATTRLLQKKRSVAFRTVGPLPESILCWPRAQAKACFGGQEPSVLARKCRFEENLAAGLVMHTDFSGQQCPETAVRMALRGAAQEGVEVSEKNGCDVVCFGHGHSATRPAARELSEAQAHIARRRGSAACRGAGKARATPARAASKSASLTGRPRLCQGSVPRTAEVPSNLGAREAEAADASVRVASRRCVRCGVAPCLPTSGAGAAAASPAAELERQRADVHAMEQAGGPLGPR